MTLELTALFPGTGETGIWDYAGFAGSVVFTLGGTLVAYWQNGGGTARVSWPVFSAHVGVDGTVLVFLLPLLVLAMIPMVYFSEAFFGTDTEDADFTALSMYVVMLSWVWFLVFYYRLAVHIRMSPWRLKWL